MRNTVMTAASLLALLALPASAEGDAEAGKKGFNKCKACHMVVDDAGEVIVKGGKQGPNLYGIAGRKAGSLGESKMSDALVAAGEGGLMWDEEQFTAYVADPTGFLRETTGDSSARGLMTFRLKKAEDAANIWAFLGSVGPAAE